jgi:hypothetical protein
VRLIASLAKRLAGAAWITAAVALVVCPDAAAQGSFSWTVPEKLGGTGVDTAARSVEEAARPPGTVIELRRCSEDATWTLDGEEAEPEPTGRRCVLRLDLGDNEAHELAVDGGEAATVQARDYLVVSIGDSVASGEGNPDRGSLFAPAWIERRCHRSMRSGAARAALALEAGSPQSSVTFLPLGCSGATVPAGLLGRYGGVEPDGRALRAQIDELTSLDARRNVDAVLLSVGANDVHFADIAIFCARPSPRCQDDRFDPDGPDGPVAANRADAVVAAALDELRNRYDNLAGALTEAGIEPARVIITEYFDPTGDENGDTCAAVLPGVHPVEAEWAQASVVTPLNAAVRAAAATHGWRLVGGVQQAFARHGICARPRTKRWIVQIPESLWRGAGFKGPLHPNEAGHLATSAMIGPVLASAIDFEGGSAAAEIAAESQGEGGIRWFQVGAGLLIGLVLGAAMVLLAQRLRGGRGAR